LRPARPGLRGQQFGNVKAGHPPGSGRGEPFEGIRSCLKFTNQIRKIDIYR
jgi:hypothetical protein